MESEQHLLNLTTLELIRIIQDLKDENECISNRLFLLSNHQAIIFNQSEKIMRYEKALKENAEKYKKEIINLRGKAHLSCPNCYEDCMGWVSDGAPCGDNW